MEETEESKSVRTIKGPCFADCHRGFMWRAGKWCGCQNHGNTAPVPKIESGEARQNVPPLLPMVAALLVSLSGCATPQKLIEMNRRALELAKGAEARCKDEKSCAAVAPCAEASERAARDAQTALRKQADAVRMTEGATADNADRALRIAERECR